MTTQLPAFVSRSILALAACATSFVFVASADARSRRSYEDGGVVYAESRFGNGTISAPVRRGAYGWDVRLPRGTWVGCRTSCEETLRVQTVDLVEHNSALTAGYGAMATECGVFGCLELRFPRD